MSEPVEIQSFADLGLDNRLVKALSKQGIETPTMIQSSAIPFALQGKDVLAKAKTGSGKTLAYLLPALHRVLTETGMECGVAVVVLVPSRDLAKQVGETLKELMLYCPKEVRAVNLASEDSHQLQKAALTAPGSKIIVIGTPSRLIPHAALLKKTSMLVIDEADLILGFGYGTDMEQLVSALPQTVHSLLMSASLTPEVDQLKQLLLHNAVTLKLEDPIDEQENLKQFTIELASQEEKFLLIYVILKLGLLKGKIMVFVNEVDRGYRLKLFLEQFGIKSCVVNAELPLASRHHIVEEFNKGVYDLLIASDQAVQVSHHTSAGKEKKKAKKNMEGESMARGIDFKRVDVVLNFDFPSRVDSYIHRVGRTARAGQQGTAISFVCPSEDGPVLSLVRADVLDRTGKDLAPYAFDMKQIEGFRYRCQDAVRSVTGASVKEARLKDLKRELVASERLKTFFAERPKDLELLKHDKGLLAANKAKPHLKHVPAYLVKSRPAALTEDAGGETDTTPKAIPQTEPCASNRQIKSRTQRKPSSKPKTRDPLKQMKRR